MPYRMWRVLRGDRPADGSARGLPWLVVCSVTGGVACAVIIAFGVAAMGFVPYQVLSVIITLNNAVIGTIVAAILLPILYPSRAHSGCSTRTSSTGTNTPPGALRGAA
ncbi:MAG: hypothetical protein GX131_04360 [candidate division WS1 bacterium]|nr:hypothetical protein [candidate division WS1 bacterium]